MKIRKRRKKAKWSKKREDYNMRFEIRNSEKQEQN